MTRPAIDIIEVGPRDGLQNEPQLIAAEDKITLIDLLSACGLNYIEATSFVSPKWVPQMADASAVLKGIKRVPSITYAALTPNQRGFDDALAADVDEVAVFGAASETFSMKNINCSIAESLQRFAPVMASAQAHQIPVRGYVSCVIACPYDGKTDPDDVLRVAEKLLEMGCYEISLGDTIGAGQADTMDHLLTSLLRYLPAEQLAGHCHDTGGQALANVGVALDHGISRFDSAVGGLGGCPYAPGAKGNLATGSLVRYLESKGYDTGVDLLRLKRAEDFLATLDFTPRSKETTI